MASGYAISKQRIVQAIDRLSDSPSAFKCSGPAMALTFAGVKAPVRSVKPYQAITKAGL